MADTLVKSLVFCDLSRGYFTENRYSTQIINAPFGQFFSKDSLNLEVYPLVLLPGDPSTTDPFSLVSSAPSLTFAIFDPSGNLLASTSTFSYDAGQGLLTGQLDCNTVAMAAYVVADRMPVIIEARFSGSFGSKNVRADGTIRKQLNTSGTPASAPLNQFYTKEETNGLLLNLVVESIKWISPDRSKQKLQYLGNDDQMKFPEIT